jgi:hypothetical protein
MPQIARGHEINELDLSQGLNFGQIDASDGVLGNARKPLDCLVELALEKRTQGISMFSPTWIEAGMGRRTVYNTLLLQVYRADLMSSAS